MTNSPEYEVWSSMVKRCHNPSHRHWRNYGGRGIAVCQEWRESFTTFLADMGHRPEGATLERKNNDVGYTPENCTWASRRDQANNRRTNRLLSFNGKTQTMAEWSRELGIKAGTIHRRLKSGSSIPDALRRVEGDGRFQRTAIIEETHDDSKL